jgi:CubicO group peptidase (beta-lactamase class C family)
MELAAFGAITSVVVSRRGEIVLEQHLDGEPDALRNTRSCTKTIVGSLLGIAIERGLVPGVDARLTRLLGRETREAEKQAITLRDLLIMSSCLECSDWDDFSAGNEENMYPTDDWVGFALGLPVREARGFSYCTAGVVCLGVALERALGEPLPDFAERELFAPLGIDRWHWPQTPRGESSAAGGLELTSRALHDLGRAHLERRLVPSAWLEDAMAAQTRIDAETEYGYLWWLRSFGGHRSAYMTGMGGNRVHLFPELDAVAVITSTNFHRRDAHALSDRLLVERLVPLVV